MQGVTEGAGLITGENFLGQGQLPGAPQQEIRGLEALRRLGRATVDHAHDHVKTEMHVHAQFDCPGFARSGFYGAMN